MDLYVPAFQFELRYNHILNFSQIGREIVAPFVKLAQGIKLENQGTINERIILNFDDDEYLIIINWDRIIIRGQGNIDAFLSTNSPIEIPFLGVLNKLRSLEQFGSIQNGLFAITYVKKISDEKAKLFDLFSERFLTSNAMDLLNNPNDMAVTLERKKPGEEITFSFGPYYGIEDLSRRHLKPPYFELLKEIDFNGFMIEYKHLKEMNDFKLSDFIQFVEDSKIVYRKLWKMF